MTPDMTPATVTIAAAILSLGGYLAAIAAGLRLGGQAYAGPLFAGAALAIPAIVPAIAAMTPLHAIMLWHYLALYFGGVAVAIFVYGAVLKSLSLRMCAFIARAPDARAGIDTLADGVIRAAFVERIDALQSIGAVERHGAGFVATEKGCALARRIARIRAALRLENSGLYSD